MEEHVEKLCPVCGKALLPEDAVRVCPDCGAALHETCWNENGGCPSCGAAQTTAPRVCGKCGAALTEEQAFCPKCGTPYRPGGAAARGGGKKRIAIIAAVAVVVIVAAFLLLRGKPVESVTLEQGSLTLVEGETGRLKAEIDPEDADDAELTWTSSDKSVAAVSDQGVVTAVAEGECVITASTENGKEDDCRVTVEPAGPDLQGAYDSCCDSAWATLASDGSYLTIDTNPDNDEDYMDYEAYMGILAVNAYLDLPDSLLEKMGATRAMDGRQSADYDGLEVSWSYHPDNGLEVIYEAE